MNIRSHLGKSFQIQNIFPKYKVILNRNTCKIAVEVDPDVLDKLENKSLKHRKHPGIAKPSNLQIPQQITNAFPRIIGDHSVKSLLNDGKRLNQYIVSRHPPQEQHEILQKVKKITADIDTKSPSRKSNVAELSDTEIERINRVRKQKVIKALKAKTITWKPLSFDAYESLVYIFSRSAQEFAVLSSIMHEISARDVNFKPRSYFDFGSGAGTGMWAASGFWKDSIFEYFNVDSSRDMNNFSDLILRGGNENTNQSLRNVYYRQFLPSNNTEYDLVVSAFTLFELPSSKSRMEHIQNLWRKCSGYLILAEEGTRKGCELINEARDFIVNTDNEKEAGHVFSPCPHSLSCPRLANINDNTPCNFQVFYKPLDFGEKVDGKKRATYSYVVLKKGKMQASDQSWPRIVRETLSRPRHVICRMCTSEGKLQEVIFTRGKHGKPAYRCARVSKWGDRLPINLGDLYGNTPKDGEEKVKEK